MKKKTSTKEFKKRIGIILMALALICGSGLFFLNSLGVIDIPLIPKASSDEQIKIACVGDSVTYGYGLRNWEETNYPAVLQRMLGQDYLVENFGVSGHCVQETSNQPYAYSNSYRMSLDYNADIVVFMMGSNDTKVDNWQGIEHFRDSYCKLLDSYGDAKIVLCTPPTAFYINSLGEVTRDDSDGITSFEIQPRFVEEIADMVYDVAREHSYPVVDINTITDGNPQWFEVDGTHPNEDGAKAIAEAVHEKLISLK